MIILNSISGPRNSSTAFMYSFAQRPDTTVLDEPFYAVYLSKTGLDHPGRNEVLRSQPVDENLVIRHFTMEPEKPILFLKNMAHHMEVTNHDYVDRSTNIFLIRDPARIISSYARVIEQPTMRDIGLRFQYSLFTSLREKGHSPAVVDATMLLKQPESVLRKLCDRINIPWHPAMLHWEKGPKPFDGVWAKYWYSTVHQSEGFKTPVDDGTVHVPKKLIPLYDEAKALYETFLPFAIQ